MKLFSTLCLVSVALLGATSCGHQHNWQEVAKKEFYAGRATYTHGTKYYKSCSCGTISDKTFFSNDPLTYNVVGDYETKDGKGMGEVVHPIVEYLIEDDETFRKYKISYETYNLHNDRIRLSAAITVPFKANQPNIKGFVVDHHPTITDKDLAPTIKWTQMTISSIAECALLQCDLIGLGDTSDMVDDYHCRHLSDRNTMDGILAAQQFLKSNFQVDIANLKTFNVGYSQGGYDSLSFARYMEQEATDEEKAVAHIEHTYSGAGAYNIQVMFDDSLANENFKYTEYVLLGVMSSHEYHPEAYGDLTVDDFLTETGKELHQVLNRKNDAELDAFKESHDCAPRKIFIGEYLDNKESRHAKAVEKAAALENLLDDKWLPSGKVWLFYPENDDIVTTRCSKIAAEKFKDLKNVEVDIDRNSPDHRSGGTVFYVITFLKLLAEL